MSIAFVYHSCCQVWGSLVLRYWHRKLAWDRFSMTFEYWKMDLEKQRFRVSTNLIMALWQQMYWRKDSPVSVEVFSFKAISHRGRWCANKPHKITADIVIPDWNYTADYVSVGKIYHLFQQDKFVGLMDDKDVSLVLINYRKQWPNDYLQKLKLTFIAKSMIFR